ncbi:hypothetical protein FF011L_35960 [Roseimaritima multifibrata]|uniref:Cellulose-binding Sde182 nucleoside hydrolase-like domain-containing protein n=1 Tax=Roseimaritima multifibrata TaxID=1930274 RepID=A0A517MIZ0_9BACT|nr:DUF1593 domain-containing protein [Roseimaritima multifibrata]QDS94814.1 hypothetical protein FF011L_35960 [Roseimaritima multifibrata]
MLNRCCRLLVLGVVLGTLFAMHSQANADERPRLLVLTDIGGDPDDRQSMIRLMVYSNAFRIEGLVATASGVPGELKEKITQPHLIREIVSAYGEVRPNLAKHEEGWPTVEQLSGVIKTGSPQRGRKHIGKGNDTEGSAWLIERIDAGSPEDPLNIAIWGGQSDLAQALWRVQTDRSAAEYAKFVKRFRVYDIADQDRIANWMHEQFPGLYYILSRAPAGKDSRTATFRGMYLTGNEQLTSEEWIRENILGTGPLGSRYPLKTHTNPNPYGCLKEGDTPSWFFFLPKGGNDPTDPTKSGWGGQFYQASDGWYRDDGPHYREARETVSRWREKFQEDFALRMSWSK